MSEIRSYRRVFDLERRVYSVDRIRLNPGGVPVRGIAYVLVLMLVVEVAARLPGSGMALELVPWYLRDLVLPAALAAVLATVRLDGRAFHVAAWSLACALARPRRTTSLQRRSRAGSSWRPPELLFLADGSGARLRALRYAGPGAVRIQVEHRRRRPSAQPWLRRGSTVLEVHPSSASETDGHDQVIWLAAGSELVVVSERRS